MSFGIGSYAREQARYYCDSDVTVTDVSYGDELGINGLLVFDTSDHRHWFGSSDSDTFLETQVSLVHSRVYWSLRNGFSYAPAYWDDVLEVFRHGKQRPIPWVE